MNVGHGHGGGHEHVGGGASGRGRAHAHEGLQPTVCVLRRELDLVHSRGGEAIEELVRAFVRDFAADLVAAGCVLIGHVKGAVEDGAGGVLYFNTTGVAATPMVRGRLSGLPRRLTMNAIVFGIAEDEVERVALQALRRRLGEVVSDGDPQPEAGSA